MNDDLMRVPETNRLSRPHIPSCVDFVWRWEIKGPLPVLNRGRHATMWMAVFACMGTSLT